MGKLIKVSKYINQHYSRLILPFVALFAALLFADLFFGLFDTIDPTTAYEVAKEFAGLGMTLVIVAFLFAPYRYIFMRVKKRYGQSVPKFFQSVAIISSNLHPFLESVGFLMVMLHGYYFAFKIYQGSFDLIAVSGMVAAVLFIGATISGYTLKKELSSRLFRRSHQLLVSLFIAAYIAHRIAMA